MLKKSRKSMLLLALTAAVVMLTGCPGPNDPSSDPTNSSGLPVIQIQTTNPKDPKNPLAFVTDPISDSVKIHAMTYNSYLDDPIYSAPAPWYEECKVTVKNKSGSVEFDNLDAKVKSRGNYTTTYDKKGLRIKFDKKQSVLGMHDGKKFKNWVLLAEWKDYSMIRDYVSLNLMRMINEKLYSSDCQLVEVYINDTYWGVYLLVEQQEAKRVEITEPENDKNITDTNIGYLLEFDNYAQLTDTDGLTQPLVSGGYIEEPEKDYICMEPYGTYYDVNGEKVPDLNQYYTIKSDYNEDCKTRIKGYMDNLWTICREAVVNEKFYEFNSINTGLVDSSAKTVEECVSKVIDIDSLVATVIQQEIVCDLDLQWSSFYMDVDLNPENPKKLTFEAPWDFDSTFGNHRERQIKTTGNPEWDITHLVSVTGNAPCRGNPWTIIFAGQEWYQDKVRAKWAELNKANVKGQLISMINSISNDSAYKAAFKRNYDKWGNIGKMIGDELLPENYGVATQREAADLVINFINQRWPMLDKDFETFQSSNKAVTYSDSITTQYEFEGTKYTETMEVTAEHDGLHITRTMDERWDSYSVQIYDVTLGIQLPRIDSPSKDVNNFVYKFVEKNHIYQVWVEGQDSDGWKGYHSTGKAKVKANGGRGDVYYSKSTPTWDTATRTLTYTQYKPSFDKDELGLNDISYQLTVFDGQPWGAGVNATYGVGASDRTDGSNFYITINENERWNGAASGGVILCERFMDTENKYYYYYEIYAGKLW